MTRRLSPRSEKTQPRAQFPTLRGAYADAVFVYLPSIAKRRAGKLGLSLGSGAPDAVSFSYFFNKNHAYFDDTWLIADAGTLSLAFNNTGMTVLTAGFYQNTGSGIRNIVNRSNAGQTGGFNVNYFNSVGAGPRIYSSYNHPSTGDTNWDSAWVNGAKDSTGNGSFTTAIDTRYVFAGTAAVGPAASVTTEIILGKEAISGQPGGFTAIELVVIWPRKFTEQQMQEITRDPYCIFQVPGQFHINGITSDVTVGITGVSSTTSINNPGVGVSKGIADAVSATGSVGVIVPGLSSELVSHTITTSINNPVYSNTKALTGQTATGSVGTVSVETTSGDLTIGLTGVTGTGSVGTLGKEVTKALQGVLGINIIGVITASGGTVATTGNPWRSVAFAPSVAPHRSVAEYAGITGNESV